jgi:hypothetical protein
MPAVDPKDSYSTYERLVWAAKKRERFAEPQPCGWILLVVPGEVVSILTRYQATRQGHNNGQFVAASHMLHLGFLLPTLIMMQVAGLLA